MNTTYTEAMALVDALKESLTEEVVGETGVIITPPALYLSDVVESLVDNPFIAVAAQNCHEKESGAYTGEWSAPMLASLDIDAIIIGNHFYALLKSLQYSRSPLIRCSRPVKS